VTNVLLKNRDACASNTLRKVKLNPDNARITQVTLRRVRESLLLWESNKYYTCVCACVCQGAWTCACACVHVALFIQHVTRMRHNVTSLVASMAPAYLSTLSHKRKDFRKILLNMKFVF
jgi:hypothetical protein